MKIVFFGTPSFAAHNLQYLINNGHEVAAIVTPPDSKTGRGKQLKACAVKKLGLINNLPILQPDRLRKNEFVEKLKSFNANLFVVVAFRMLPEVVWKIPPKGTINLHTSLLPNYKGAAPINWVLINGEEKTGISTFFINNEIDSGEIILQEKIALSNTTTAAELHNTLIPKGNNLLIKTLNLIENNSLTKIAHQSNSSMLGAPKLTKEILKINWAKSASNIHNLVRGLSPFLNNNTILKDVSICPSAWFFLEDPNGQKKRVKVHCTEVIKSNPNDRLKIKTDNKTYLHITTKKDMIAILNLQVEGKKPMTIQQFLQGNKLTENHKIL